MESPDSLKQVEEQLDSEISSIRREIRNLQRRRRLLTSSLLSSDNFQKRLKARQAATAAPTPISSLTDEVSPLAQAADKHAELNHHRVAFSTTTFPFKDPSPHSDHPNLLGVRIDICCRNGRFTKPYYVLLRRADTGDEKRLRVHRHTIPAFIPLEKLESVYLPLPPTPESTEEDAPLKPGKGRVRRQDLRGLVRELRRQLVAWHLRVDAVNMLKEDLGGVQDGTVGGGVDESRLEPNDLGIVSLAPTALEARYIRLEWEDGRVGRFRLSDTGVIERAVVIGDRGRDKRLEALFIGGDGRVETLLDRLRQHAISISGE
ncbi:hypothetical protein CNMCM6936_000094 [Aspergillus lentulus]|uniref:Cenp-O kinetochore centromere component n=1 Tax=Aspergillus lentulus TaxID=293939 RepID=A0AAN5YIC4_ASPLE|nr:hypothetical protein CNMCM6069_002068 [Aspergillus lentulus]KAF4163993.1 hypothetical protein CNMCM6936_000094 [Aspergillus lentulus]KAF4201949.1 hypothetical protein CNMCM8927_000911 [Aspergillus lentulus]GFF54405.1 hypothetical protein IFM62136_02574 [Aspergillus lentulus]GFF86386.1 hypothetical protein IFM60648_07688 [Aspergillus lentulus]